MIYALFIWMAGDKVVIETFPSILKCKIHESRIIKENPGANTTCILMEEKQRV